MKYSIFPILREVLRLDRRVKSPELKVPCR